jgi:uncharacterized membrane protein YfcA
MIIKGMLVVLALLAVWFAYIFGRDYVKAYKEGRIEKAGNPVVYAIMGTVINFFDALGIGSFAVSTASFKLGKMLDDKLIPGTLNVATTTSLIAEAFIYMTIVEIDSLTVLLTIICAMLGAYVGASIVSKLPRKKIQLGMGTALIIVAILLILGLAGLLSMNGTAIGLRGFKLIIACTVCFILGMTNCIGIGMFAPTMAMAALLGLSPIVAYPIMTGGSAFLQPIASYKFIKENSYNRKLSLVWSIFGVVGVIIAAFLVKSLPVRVLKMVVVVVVVYTSISMFVSALGKPKKTENTENTEA